MEVGPQPHHIAMSVGSNHGGRTPTMQDIAPRRAIWHHSMRRAIYPWGWEPDGGRLGDILSGRIWRVDGGPWGSPAVARSRVNTSRC